MPRSSKGFKVTLMLPLRDNAGRPIDRDTWSWWHDKLTALVAGFTDLGVVSGWWRGYTDENRRITIIVRSMREVQALRRCFARHDYVFTKKQCIWSITL